MSALDHAVSSSASSSTPHSMFLNASIQELLMIEMTSLCYRLSRAPVAVDSDTITTASTEEEEMSDSERLESKLESIGFRVGHGLVERFARDRPMLTDHLDMIKFVCKDLWMLLYNKQIDNLKTNHRGVYVLSDQQFKWFAKMSWNPRYKDGKEYSPYLWYPCGIIRGALQNLGMESVVIAECPNGPPGITFQIKTINKSES